MSMVTRFVDDVTGVELTNLPEGFHPQVVLVVDGQHYRADLAPETRETVSFADLLNAAVAFTPEAPKPARKRRASGSSGGSRKNAKNPNSESAMARAWYKSQGGEIGEHGRLPEHVIASYRDAVNRNQVAAEFLVKDEPEDSAESTDDEAQDAATDAAEGSTEADASTDVQDDDEDDSDPFGEGEGDEDSDETEEAAEPVKPTTRARRKRA